VQIAEKAGGLINEIVPAIQKTATLVQEITAASEEQTAGVAQVNTAMGQLDQGAQQAASSSEELAATSEEMNSQAAQLQETIGFFKLTASGSVGRRTESHTQAAKPAKKSVSVALSNEHLTSHKPAATPRPASGVKHVATATEGTEARKIKPHKITPENKPLKVEPVHHQKSGFVADKPVEGGSKDDMQVNEKDFEGF